MRSRGSIFRDGITRRQAAAASVAAVFSTFAFISLISERLYSVLPTYTQPLVGQTIWQGYPKQADLQVARLVLFGLPVFFVLFLLVTSLWKKYLSQKRKETFFFSLSYMTSLLMILARRDFGTQYLVLTVLLAVAFFLHTLGCVETQFLKLVRASFLTLAAFESLLLFGAAHSSAIRELWLRTGNELYAAGGLLVLLLVILHIATQAKRSGINPAEGMIRLSALVLPVGLLGMYTFVYRFSQNGEPEVIRLFASGRLKWFLVLLAVVLCIVQLVFILTGKRVCGIPLWVSLAFVRTFRLPQAVMSIDYFHNGEITLPMQQLVQFHKLPYKDIIPIHGLCDYYYGLVDYLFFDGSYLSLDAAKMVGDLFLAGLFAIAMGLIIRRLFASWGEKSESVAELLGWIILPFLIRAGMRYAAAFIMMAVLFCLWHENGRALLQIYVWTACSIIAIAWNPSIGGAAALAFLPVMYLQAVKAPSELKAAFSQEKKGKGFVPYLGAWLILLLAGVAFIPLFLSIVSYLRENTGTTLYVNGMEMIEELEELRGSFTVGLFTGQSDFFVRTFGFAIVLAILLAALFLKKGKQFYGLLTLWIFFYVIASYTFVRFDQGLRTGVVGGYTLLLVAMLLIKTDDTEKNGLFNDGAIIAFIMMALFVWLADVPVFADVRESKEAERIESFTEIEIMGQSVEDPLVYVSGDSVGLEGLGTGFVPANALQNLKNIAHVVETWQGSWLDLTSAPAYEVILAQPLRLPYTSAYNISNDVMQEKAIGLLAKDLPDALLLSPQITFDEAPFSYRCFRLYRYLMRQGYVPYRYENVLYMLREGVENTVPGSETGDEMFAAEMSKKEQGMLPAIWGSSVEKNGFFDGMEETEIPCRIEDTENGCRIVFEDAVDGAGIDMLGLTMLACGENEELQMRVEAAKDDEEKEPFCWEWTASEHCLIPVGASPNFTQSHRIKALQLTTSADIAEVRFFRLKDTEYED